MKTIILAGMATDQLALLTEGLSTGTLQFLSKPLLAHSIASVQAAMKSTIYVQQEKKQNGLNRKLSPDLEWNTVLHNVVDFIEDELDDILWLRDDVLYNIDFSELLERLRNHPASAVAVLVQNTPILFYRKAGAGKLQNGLPKFKPGMDNRRFCEEMLKSNPWQSIQLPEKQAVEIDSPKKFHDASMKLLKGDFENIVIDSHQDSKRFFKGWHNKIAQASQMHNYAFLGDCVYVHKESRLQDHVILSKGSYIDRFVDITNSIVMPGVYVGPFLNLTNSIVTGNKIIRIDTGIVIPIEDNKFLKKISA